MQRLIDHNLVAESLRASRGANPREHPTFARHIRRCRQRLYRRRHPHRNRVRAVRPITLTFEVSNGRGQSYGYHSLSRALAQLAQMREGELLLITWRCPDRADGRYRPCCELIERKRA